MSTLPSVLEEMIIAEAPSIGGLVAPLLGPTIGPILDQALPVAASFIQDLQSGKIRGAGAVIPEAIKSAASIAVTVGAGLGNPIIMLIGGGVEVAAEIYELAVEPKKLSLPLQQKAVAAQVSEKLAKEGSRVPAHLVNMAVALTQATGKKAA